MLFVKIQIEVKTTASFQCVGVQVTNNLIKFLLDHIDS